MRVTCLSPTSSYMQDSLNDIYNIDRWLFTYFQLSYAHNLISHTTPYVHIGTCPDMYVKY
jgi:hypothetical protein